MFSISEKKKSPLEEELGVALSSLHSSIERTRRLCQSTVSITADRGLFQLRLLHQELSRPMPPLAESFRSQSAQMRNIRSEPLSESFRSKITPNPAIKVAMQITAVAAKAVEPVLLAFEAAVTAPPAPEAFELGAWDPRVYQSVDTTSWVSPTIKNVKKVLPATMLQLGVEVIEWVEGKGVSREQVAEFACNLLKIGSVALAARPFIAPTLTLRVGRSFHPNVLGGDLELPHQAIPPLSLGRSLLRGDFGMSNDLIHTTDLTGRIWLYQQVLMVRVSYIKATNPGSINFMKAVEHLRAIAKREGASRIEIQAIFSNQRLKSVIMKKYPTRFDENANVRVISIPLS